MKVFSSEPVLVGTSEDKTQDLRRRVQATVSYLKVWTSGTSLRLWPLILWTSLAAALIIFSTRFSCSCSS